MCEWPDIFEEIIRKARKLHKCCECHKTITKGILYYQIDGLWNGEWEHYKQCFYCRFLGLYARNKSDENYPLGDLYSWLFDWEYKPEDFEEDYPELSKLRLTES